MASPSLLRSVARDRVALFLMVVLIAAAGWFVFTRSGGHDRPMRLRLSAGRPQGPRHAMAEALADEARKLGLDLIVVPTAGSEESLDRLDAGQIDVAMIQGGLDLAGRGHLRQVASLHVEPMHLLVKKEILDDCTKSLDALRGRSVSLGEVGSGTRALALSLMRFARMSPGEDFRDVSLGYDRLESAPSGSRDRLPDAVFMVSLLPSRVAKTLVARHDYRLVPLPFGEAFSLDGLGADASASASKESGDRIRREDVIDAAIPPFTYGVRPAVPPLAIPTLGARMLMVARDDADADAVARLLEATFAARFANLAHPPLSPKVMELPSSVPPHPGMLLYQERSKPVVAGDVIDALEKELSIAGALVGASFFFWQWLKGRFRRAREVGFEHYILKVAEVERRALTLELAPTLDLPGLLALQDELGRLKSEAIGRFADGDLTGEDLMSGFLAHASDARDHLTRLILHRRDDLERQAREQKRGADTLWREAVGDVPAPPRDDEAPADHGPSRPAL